MSILSPGWPWKQVLLVSHSLHCSQRLSTVIEHFNFGVTCQSISANLSPEEARVRNQHIETSLFCSAEAGSQDWRELSWENT